MGLGSTLIDGGNVYGKFTGNIDAAYETGQRQTQAAQLAALRQQAINHQALTAQMRDAAASQQPNGVMPAPNIAPGYSQPWNEPPPAPRPQAPMFSPEQQASAEASDAGGLPPPSRARPAGTGAGFFQPPVGFSPPMAPPRDTTAPATRSGGQMPPYGAHGRGMTRNFGPVTPYPANPQQGDVRRFNQSMNPDAPVVKPYRPSGRQGTLNSADTPNNSYLPTPEDVRVSPEQQNQRDLQRIQIMQQEAATAATAGDETGELNSARELGKVGYDKQIQAQSTAPISSQYNSIGPSGGARAEPKPSLLDAPGPGIGAVTAAPTAPPPVQAPVPPAQPAAGATPAMPAMSNNIGSGQEYFGGQQNGQQHYGFYDQLAQQQTKMAQIHMLSGDPDRAQAAIVQANMARLEQYNILSTQALQAARRGDPTQLLSLMNFYDPNAGYSVRPLQNGGVQVLSNGQPLGMMSQGEFINNAQLLVSKAYYDKMLDLRMKLYEKQAEAQIKYGADASLEDIKGRWHVDAMKEAALARGLKIVVDSASSHAYATDSQGNSYIYHDGVPIAGSKFPTAGEWVPIGRGQ